MALTKIGYIPIRKENHSGNGNEFFVLSEISKDLNGAIRFGTDDNFAAWNQNKPVIRYSKVLIVELEYEVE